jgi:sodium/proline symporter
LFALLITPFALLHAAGCVDQTIALISAVDAERLNPWHGLTTVGLLSLFAWGLGYAGQPHILARFMAAKSSAAIAPARRIAMLWMALCLFGAMSAGFLAIGYLSQHPSAAALVNQNNERVFIVVAQQLFNPWLAGVLLSAILAAIMSTLSCQLLVAASALVEDGYKPLFRPNASQTELLWVGRAALAVIALIAIALAADPDSRVLKLVGYAWAGFGAAFGPVIVLSLYDPKMTGKGALAGMLTGAATVLIWGHYQWFALYEMLPGVVFATMATLVVSRLTQTTEQARLVYLQGWTALRNNTT